jgi:hypothetical protein
MKPGRIEITLSKWRTIMGVTWCIIFVIGSCFIISIAHEQDRYSPFFVKAVGFLGMVFFGIFGLVSILKLFDSRPALVIDEKGIFNNTTAGAAYQINWEHITGIRVGQTGAASAKYILLDIDNPEDFLRQRSGLNKIFMKGTYKMDGTPVFIAASRLPCGFDELLEVLNERLYIYKNPHEASRILIPTKLKQGRS